jgi:hypothetical protein
MSLPATDNFNRADDPSSLGANWTIQSGTVQIISNQASLQTPNTEVFWNADAFANDHYSQVLVVVSTANDGCVVRASGTGGSRNNYLSYNNSNIYKDVGGSYTLLGSGSGSASNGDTIKMTATGTTIAVLINGVQKNSVTDSTFTSGSAGVFGDNAAARVDNWTGDNIGGAVADTLEWRGCYPVQKCLVSPSVMYRGLCQFSRSRIFVRFRGSMNPRPCWG